MTDNSNYTKKIYVLLFFLSVVASLFVAKLLSSFLLPVIFSIFLALVFLPIIVKITQKTKLNWTVTSILIVIIFIALCSFIFYFLYISASTFAKEYPKYDQKFKDVLERLSESLHLNFNENLSFGQNIWEMFNISSYVQDAAITLSSGIITFIKSFFLVLIFLALILIEAKHFKNKINLLAQRKNKTQVLVISKRIAEEVVRYLSIKFFISLATGTFVFVGLKIIGLDFAILWAFLAFILNFIPTFGSLFSVVITSAFALMQLFPSWDKIIFVLVYMTAVNCTIGNLLEPKIVGSNLGISTFIVVLSLTLFGWIWGFVGMIVAVPLLVIIKIICENIPLLHPIALFLSDDENKTQANLTSLD
ncbi:MAG: AI-2E family transporter [Treponema sp.]|nr:AI-2E family transporter [Treponema sp.]